jgi:DNA-binding NarL/FixJ family response regulator
MYGVTTVIRSPSSKPSPSSTDWARNRPPPSAAVGSASWAWRGSRAGPGRDPDQPGGLAARQLDVLDLVAQGLTDAEIGQRLFVSTRTVDHHVSAVLAKLGVATRREAVNAATASHGRLDGRS